MKKDFRMYPKWFVMLLDSLHREHNTKLLSLNMWILYIF